ncbi:hypothetical protein ACP70R_037411 [Stipagrostis hirtigluma subsp. patula]
MSLLLPLIDRRKKNDQALPPIRTMDLEALLSRFDGEPRQHHMCKFLASTVLFVLATAAAALFGHSLLVDPDLTIGHINFSMEPVAYTGLGPAGVAAPPAFNVTMHATSSFKHEFCTSGGATVQAAFSGLTIAVGKVAPFCVEPKGSAVIAGTASSAWTALPDDFRERIHRDRRINGGVEVEVNLSFENEFKGPMWVRCRAMLDANRQNTPCRTFKLSYC